MVQIQNPTADLTLWYCYDISMFVHHSSFNPHSFIGGVNLRRSKERSEDAQTEWRYRWEKLSIVTD